MPGGITMLAGVAAADGMTTRLVLLVAGVLALGGLVLAARGLCRKWQQKTPVQGFSMEEVEALRQAGQITEAEFVRLRAAALHLEGPADENGKTKSSACAELDDEAKDPEEGGLCAGEGA